MGKRLWGLVFVFVLGFLLLGAAGCGQEEQQKLRVATGTSLIAAIVSQLGGEHVEVTNIIPPGACPGHFDLKPSDVQKLAKARLFLRHDWQGQMFTADLIKSVHNEELVVVPLAVKGNWMAPPVQRQAIEKIAAVLTKYDPAHKRDYEENKAKAVAAVEAKERELRSRLAAAGVENIKVLCAEMQQGFVSWAGFKVVATYGRPEELTPEKVAALIRKGKEEGVKLVIDNLQSGPDAGKQIAAELGAARVVLSNFPGAWPGTATWEAAVTKNVDLLLEAVKKAQGQGQ